MSGNAFLRFITIVIFLIILLGCGKVTTTYSTMKIDVKDIDKIEEIIHAAFVSSGYIDGERKAKNRERNYWIWLENKGGRAIDCFYTVSYGITKEGIEIRVRNVSAVDSPEILACRQKTLMDMTKKIEDMFNEAHIKATIETKSYWETIIACI